MNGIEYVALVAGTAILIIAVAADNWRKRNKK